MLKYSYTYTGFTARWRAKRKVWVPCVTCAVVPLLRPQILVDRFMWRCWENQNARDYATWWSSRSNEILKMSHYFIQIWHSVANWQHFTDIFWAGEKVRVIWTNVTKTYRLGHEKHTWYNINLLDFTVICKKRDKPTVCCCRLTIFLRIQQQSHGLARTALKKRESEKKKLFHLNRDRGEERGIRRMTKRPTDWV